MRNILTLLICTTLFVSSNLIYSQSKPIGSWTDHLPYQVGVSMAQNGDQIFCGTKSGVFIYNHADGSINRWSKINLLNDILVSKIGFVPSTKALIVIYDNANIDLVKNGQVINIPFIKDNTRINGKGINSISYKGDLAYLSFDFGIVVLDSRKNEIKDSYIFGNTGSQIPVNTTYVGSQFIWAGTDEGIYRANLNSNLLDFNNWSKVSFQQDKRVKKIIEFNGRPYTIIQSGSNGLDSLYNLNTQRAVPSYNAKKFVALSVNGNQLSILSENLYEVYDTNLVVTNQFGLGSANAVGIITHKDRVYMLNNFHPLLQFNQNGDNIGQIKPNGPFERNVFDIDASQGKVWAVSGGHTFSYSNAFQFVRIYRYEENRWTSFIEFSIPSLQSVFDVVTVTIDPEDENHVVFGSWGNGLFEWNGSLPFKQYLENGTGLIDREALADWVGVGECRFDSDGNLWVTNTFTSTCLAVKKKNGSWKNFKFPSQIGSEETPVKELMITQSGHKWISLPTLNEIIVFDDNGTIDNESDDRKVLLKQEEGQGAIPGIRGVTFAEDLDGEVWLGTSDGIAVYYSPDDVFVNGKRDAERILVSDGDNFEILLENVRINDIEVNGNNEKWVATDGSGVFLLSEDGQRVIANFKTDNSPLISDNVLKVTVDEENGEVYFATGQGIVSYRGASIKGSENLSEVVVYPNPVRPDYDGLIAIKGLMDKTRVKITDINGVIVNEIISQGGQVLWDGRNFSGEEVSNGVYLIFSSAEDEEDNLKTQIGKLLYMR